MSALAWLVAVVLPVAWAVQAILSALIVARFARNIDKPRRPGYADYRPPVALIVPFKGVDLDMPRHLAGLFTQDYPDYRLVLVTDSEADPAYPMIRNAIASHPERPVDLLVAGPAGDHEGQKVHNLLAALDHLEQQGTPAEILAFADSDAVPGPNWLANLVGPLIDPRTGATTGYRWFVPSNSSQGSEESQATGNLPTRLASIINSSVACFAGRERYNHAWGGSMALRVTTAREGDLAGVWRGALSDDYQVSRMCKALGRRIYFVHQCLVATPAQFTWPSLFEFGRRQYVITRTHVPAIYAGALFLTTLYALGFACTLATLVWNLAFHFLDYGWVLPGVAIIVHGAASDLRGHFREQAVRKAFGDATATQLRPALRLDSRLPMLHMLTHWLIVASALFGRTITWRGNRYRIDGPQEIVRE